MNMRKVILASASPRRKELLRQVGVDFETLPAVGEEITTKEDPAEAVQELALQKASEAAFPSSAKKTPPPPAIFPSSSSM